DGADFLLQIPGHQVAGADAARRRPHEDLAVALQRRHRRLDHGEAVRGDDHRLPHPRRGCCIHELALPGRREEWPADLRTRTACADQRGKEKSRVGRRRLQLLLSALSGFASLSLSAQIRARSPRSAAPRAIPAYITVTVKRFSTLAPSRSVARTVML